MSETDSSSQSETPGRDNHAPDDPNGVTRIRSIAPMLRSDQSQEADASLTTALSDSATPATPETEELPRQQIDRYRVLKLLGSGGFGAVYLAHDDLLRRKVSIKLPHRRRIRTAAQMQQYMNEAMMVAQLDHPKIVPVFDVGKLPDGLCYVVSKYIDCETLSDRMKRPMTPTEAIETTIDLAETLQHVHEAGIVHRDMKPSNILVNRDGQYFINDFGLAMIEVSESDRGMVIGTPAYMSPEQACGEGHLVDGRSDIFSLGVVLYEMLVGRRPFRGGSTEQVLYQIRTLEPKPLRQLNRTLPIALERVCQKALAKQTGRRYASAIELAEDLRQVLGQWQENESQSFTSGEASDGFTKSDSNSGSVSDTSGPTTSGDDTRVVVIPKGLRSYDQHDAAFFKSMLPGPYDLDGCPESIRFWKNRIDPPNRARPTDNQRHDQFGRGIEPFRVGVIYGTSGCGKSSFIRAGLIPMLDESVRVCVVDATAQGTLARLTQSLSRRVPTFSEIPNREGTGEGELETEAAGVVADASVDSDRNHALKADSPAVAIDRRLASIRRGENLLDGEKVLIVIDQFEQWLNSADAGERALFVRALRQCDGYRLQTILLVRDDFWLATSRLMRELDIELSASHNLAMIDLLDKPHASKLLRMLGRAYGRLGEAGSRLHREQRQFISDAVDALASGDRVVAVQLALFAEMMKTRPWTRATLKSLSGIERVVEQFLYESFDTQSAPKNQQLHSKAAHRLLGAMLPETGLIRAGSIQRSVLARAAGYVDDPDAMTDLIRILDNKLKLITSVEVDSIGLRESTADTTPSDRDTRYQLTHDSLIPAIRRWLAKHQEGTFTGRAQRLLKARSQAWADGRDDRQLPSLFQWMRFTTLTARRDRSENEQAMMARASGKHGRSMAVVTTLLVAMILGWRYWSNESQADHLVKQLSIATTAQLPKILSRIDAQPNIVSSKLQRLVTDGSETDRVHFLASLALPPDLDSASDDELPTKDVADYLLSAKLDLVALSRARRPDWTDRFETLWAGALGDQAGSIEKRLRAGLLLAGQETSATGGATNTVHPAVEDHVAFLAGSIVDESLTNKLAYASLVDLAKPIRNALTQELISISWDSSQLARQDAAKALVRDLHADHPVDLIDAALDLPRDEFESIVATVETESLSIAQIERFSSSPNSASQRPSMRRGRATALGAVRATNGKRSNDDFDWRKRIPELVQADRDSVAAATLTHSLISLGFDRERLFDSTFDADADLRCVQLFALGEVLRTRDDVDSSFKNQCRSLARDRFRSDFDPGVFSAARWLLVRLGEQSWIDDELDKRVQRVDASGTESIPSTRLRINAQRIPMIRFQAGSIAATSTTDGALKDWFAADPLNYEIEVATDEITVERFKQFQPGYFLDSQLKSQHPRIPVGVIPWEQAVAYCQWLTLEDGMSESDMAYETDADGESMLRSDYRTRRGYRLPTAREWVAVWDADPARAACVMDDSLVEHYARIFPFSEDAPEPIGGVKPDRNGLFHLAGNAEEWCSDRVNEYRALRGAFYGSELSERTRIAEQHFINGKINYVRIGFRVTRSTARESKPELEE